MQVLMWKIILCAILYNVSWSQGLVIVKDPCEVTITKSLALLVKYLIISIHEFSSLFALFSKPFWKSLYQFLIIVFIIFLVHYCFHFFTINSSFFIFQITSPRFPLRLSRVLSCFFTFLLFLHWFQNHQYYFLHSLFSSPSPSITSSFRFFSFSSLTKKTLLITNMNELLMLLSPPVPVDSTRIAYIL